ncbi:hypothetical protein BB559_007539 [Furculomyces boomerangus]|uniref:Transcription initiation factor TFIID subunit 13 n=2 Tax=Harpellales TaxID=61421 RepID=A0A2T9XWY8_9FUNG|nr:hypothetical protein BB559_007539 [Furculomyces boomerangus]PWA03548.1 hypothetical protein BB558_000220 [Smittium angustum]
MNEKTIEIQKKQFSKAGLFAKDLPPLMYGFGDSINPNPETVNLLEDLLIDYINEICIKAASVSGKRQRVTVDDFKFALRKDPKKLARVEELISLNKEIENARKMFRDEASETEEKNQK